MKSLVICLGLLASGALFAPHASAQKPAPPPALGKAAPAASKPVSPGPRLRTAAAGSKAPAEAPGAPFHPGAKTTAAGDTALVAQAGAAAVQSPPDGFEYER